MVNIHTHTHTHSHTLTHAHTHTPWIKDRDRSPVQHVLSKLIDGHVRAAPGTIHCKQTKPNYLHPMLGAVRLSKVFIGDLQSSIHVSRRVRRGVCGKWEGSISSIHTGSGGEY